LITVEDILTALITRGRWVGDSALATKSVSSSLVTLEDKLHGLRFETANPRALSLQRRRAGLNVKVTATGNTTRPSKSGGSLSSHAADLTAGMSKADWHAILWTISLDPESQKFLTSALGREIDRSQQRDKFWPTNLRRQACDCGRVASDDYTKDLARLALMELATPHLFSTHRQRANWFGLSQQHWRQTMLKAYAVPVTLCFQWFGNGCAHIARQLGEE
jgi:hypothetical protein